LTNSKKFGKIIIEKEKEKMTMTIWFDMDGTIADLYGVENWLPMLRASDPAPYMLAKPLVRLSALARVLNRLQAEGYEIGVISWLSKTGTPRYNAEVTAAKYAWLAKHLPSVDFDEIHIVPYGTPKQIFAKPNDILFDDEERNRNDWTGTAFDVNNIMGVLKNL
jgi:hypothetical protein